MRQQPYKPSGKAKPASKAPEPVKEAVKRPEPLPWEVPKQAIQEAPQAPKEAIKEVVQEAPKEPPKKATPEEALLNLQVEVAGGIPALSHKLLTRNAIEDIVAKLKAHGLTIS